MSRGFAIGVNVATADDLTTERIADEVAAQGLLTAAESQSFLPAAVSAAQALIRGIGAGPCWVWLDGDDRLETAGETTMLRVTVSTTATPKPQTVAAPASEAVASVSAEPAEAANPEATEPVAEVTP